jgi:hypothetical protein
MDDHFFLSIFIARYTEKIVFFGLFETKKKRVRCLSADNLDTMFFFGCVQTFEFFFVKLDSLRTGKQKCCVFIYTNHVCFVLEDGQFN